MLINFIHSNLHFKYMITIGLRLSHKLPISSTIIREDAVNVCLHLLSFIFFLVHQRYKPIQQPHDLLFSAVLWKANAEKLRKFPIAWISILCRVLGQLENVWLFFMIVPINEKWTALFCNYSAVLLIHSRVGLNYWYILKMIFLCLLGKSW